MAIKRRRHAHDAKGRKQHVQELSGRLAPLEEQEASTRGEKHDADRNGPDDTIRVDSSSVKMSSQFNEGERDAAGTFYLEPVAIFIVILMLVFIAFIAWRISLLTEPIQ
jgi:hypothetical protein